MAKTRSKGTLVAKGVISPAERKKVIAWVDRKGDVRKKRIK